MSDRLIKQGALSDLRRARIAEIEAANAKIGAVRQKLALAGIRELREIDLAGVAILAAEARDHQARVAEIDGKIASLEAEL